MLVETEGYSQHLGSAAKTFLEWSKATGRMLERLPQRTWNEIPSIVQQWQKRYPFGKKPMEIHPFYDGNHFKKYVVFSLRSTLGKIETYVQLLSRQSSLMPKPYASILQAAPDGHAVSLSMGRTAHDIPDHVALRLGKVARYPQLITLSNSPEPASYFERPIISVYTNGRIMHTAQWPINKDALIYHISNILTGIFHGDPIVLGNDVSALQRPMVSKTSFARRPLLKLDF